jgi:hypothetical protein
MAFYCNSERWLCYLHHGFPLSGSDFRVIQPILLATRIVRTLHSFTAIPH